jgi:thioredoxin reductase (NADPH)
MDPVGFIRSATMFDYDGIIIGGGPAGLTAGIYLTRAGYRVLILEKETFGGQLKNIDWIENYPGFADGISGAALASAMIDQAARFGFAMKPADVTSVESFSGCNSVTCADGNGYTCGAIVVAGGSKARKLGIPGEEAFRGKGVIECALCDGGRFANAVVAVCGGGDGGVTEALYLAKLASKVILLEAEATLTASAILRTRLGEIKKVEIRCATRVREIKGDSVVRSIVVETAGAGRGELFVDGVLAHIGLDPNTAYLEGTLPLDNRGQIIVDGTLGTASAGIFAAGDIRTASPRQIAAAVGDGAIAALAAQRFLQSSG